MKKIDELDRDILKALHVDPQVTNKQLAGSLAVSEPTIATRIEGLINRGVMQVSIQRNLNATEFPMAGFVEIHTRHGTLEGLVEQIKAMPTLLAITVFADAPQLHVFLMARDAGHFREIIDTQVSPLDGVEAAEITVFLGAFYLAPGIAAL